MSTLTGEAGVRASWTVPGFLLVQVAIFLVAVAIHFGLVPVGDRHQTAGTAESVIAAVLLAGLLLTWSPSPWSRRAAVAAQTFGILGVLVGLFTIVVGIGPRTALDLALHGAMLLTLVAGLAVTLRKA